MNDTKNGKLDKSLAMLNPAQLEVVHTTGHCLVIACPGSGKTQTLACRAAYLLRQNPSTRVGTVSFGREAAKELKSRVHSLIPEAGGRLVCGTFHGLAFKQLRAANIRTEIIEGVHRLKLIRSILVEAKLRHVRTDAMAETIEEEKARATPPPNHPLSHVVARYAELLREREYFDLQDLIIAANSGMREGRVNPLPVDYLLVDEVQDADSAQYEWIELHGRAGQRITAVGDDDQCIYGWRFARGYQGMSDFAFNFGARRLLLTTSYRCPRGVLDPAAELVKKNEQRFAKELRTMCQDKGEIKWWAFRTAETEAESIASEIEYKSQSGTCGILARTNSELDPIEVALLARDVPYVRLGGPSFFEATGPGTLINFLRHVQDLKFDAVEPILLMLGIEPKPLAALREKYVANSSGSLERFATMRLPRVKSGKTVAEIQQLTAEAIRLFKRGQVGELIEAAASTVRIAVLSSESHALDIATRFLINLRGSLAQRLQFVRGKPERASTPVQLMTMHGSKGLEFDYVHIAGCSRNPRDYFQTYFVEEERRLLYVAMTRAKKSLCLTSIFNEPVRPWEILEDMDLLPRYWELRPIS